MGMEGRHQSKGQLPPLTIGGQELLQVEEGGYMQKQQSALTVIFKLVISGLTTVMLIVLNTVWFVSISLRPVLGTLAAYVTATVWSSCN